MANKEEEKKGEERYELIEVPTQTAVVVKDNQQKDEEGNPVIFQQEQVLVEILNRLDNIDKNTG